MTRAHTTASTILGRDDQVDQRKLEKRCQKLANIGTLAL